MQTEDELEKVGVLGAQVSQAAPAGSVLRGRACGEAGCWTERDSRTSQFL